MQSEEIPSEAVQDAIEGFEGWYGAHVELLYHTDYRAKVQVEMKDMDSEDRAGMVYELIESGWNLQEINMELKTITTRGSVDALPDYWTE